MQTAQKQIKNILIGLFVVVGCFLIVVIVFFISPSVGDGKQLLKVRFAHINGISIGTQVLYAGKPIGEVDKIQLVPDARHQGVDTHGQVFPFLLTLKIDSKYVIYSTDEVTVATQGLLGEKNVAIVPHMIVAEQKGHVITSKDVIYAQSSDLLESAVNEIAALSEKFEETLDKIIVWIDTYGDDLGGAIQAVEQTVKEIGVTVKEINDQHLVEATKEATVNIGSTFGQADQILYQMREDDTFTNVSAIAAHIEQITRQISLGKGTIGKLVESDGLYLQLNALMFKANLFLNDLNQYGVLYQYNKEWQRSHLKLIKEAERIENPKAFQAYMNQQVDQINSALCRMGLLTEKFNTEQLVRCSEFRKNFAEFMQDLKSLLHEVEVVNQKIVEMQNNPPECQPQCQRECCP